MIYWVRKYFSNFEVHLQAIYEVIITAIFSLTPFIVTYFVGSARRSDGSFISFDDIVGRGQIYLLAYGIFGSIFWLAFLKADRPRHGARAFLGVVATLIYTPVVGFIGVDPTFSTVLNSHIVSLSYYFYGACLLLHYLIIFYTSIDPPEPGETFGREAKEMADKYKDLGNA